MSIPNYHRSLFPRYAQVAADLRRRIEAGEWRFGDRLPPLEAFEDDFGVARVTIRQAMEILEKEGLVRRVQGKGTFVLKKTDDKRWLVMDLHLDGLMRFAFTVTSRLTAEPAEAGLPPLRQDEGTPAPAYVKIENMQFRDTLPFAVSRLWVASDLFEAAPDRFRKETVIVVVYSLLGERIARARQTFTVDSASNHIAKLLKVGIGFPTAESRIMIVDDAGRLAYLGLSSIRGDCVHFEADLTRGRQVRERQPDGGKDGSGKDG
ncbi:GntR family transcriptional regulator [Blastochloris sulfoviridis]|uniref:GntR family transcriptional regulator n=1 Tax=Blastochloris sulfoviridis TaxID=50712 RepID=A0A5M6I1J9_9HYPH|nr:GntR family transcriptional regulator [Blastochloris sulfoviridis]KAA5602074.1 GntR family transcriptional regulator [Blastochloris sulfoviridis]